MYLWDKLRQQLFSCDTPQVGSNAVIWCLWANGNIAWHASAKLSVPHSLVGWILNYRMAKWPCSHLSSLSGFIAVLCRECLPLCRQLPAGVWTNRDRARTLRKEKRVERTGKDWRRRSGEASHRSWRVEWERESGLISVGGTKKECSAVWVPRLKPLLFKGHLFSEPR